MKRILAVLFSVLFCFSGLNADTMSAEELLFMDLPEVVSAGKRAQKITEAPATVSVVTADDIKAYGFTNVPDALRIVAGVDVMDVASTQQEVSIRGFNMPLSNHVLVMVDGVPMNLNMYGSVIWSSLMVPMEEIERIEVVKSPISSLYGASAYCGVINIITKTPEKAKGTQVLASGGDYKGLRGALITANNIGDFAYKASAQWRTTNQWMNPENIDLDNKMLTANIKLEYNVDEKTGVSIGASRTDMNNVLLTGIQLYTLELDGDRT